MVLPSKGGSGRLLWHIMAAEGPPSTPSADTSTARRGWWASARHDGDAPASPIVPHRGAGAASWLTPWFFVFFVETFLPASDRTSPLTNPVRPSRNAARGITIGPSLQDDVQ